MNVYQKISEVMKRIQYLTKDDSIEFGKTKYKAISEEKVTTIIRKELIDLGIVIIPIEQERNTSELIRTDTSVNQRTDVDVKYRIQNVDDINDFVIATSSGSGVDTQDKGVGKAMTYSYKYLLLRTFAIPTGEDPDKISSAEIDSKIENERISNKMVEALTEAIRNKEYTKGYVEGILAKYKYKTLSDIKIFDLANIKKEFEI